jgi:3-oxoacyl-[acyl-carrier protein] reductase
MIDPGLKNKVVVVTGGNNPRGIGAAAAKAFAAQGAVVFIHYFRGLRAPQAEMTGAPSPSAGSCLQRKK